MTRFVDYKDRYETIALTRSDNGILEMRLHTNDGPFIWDFHGTVRDNKGNRGGTHAELAECFAQIAHDPDNRVVILTGTGNQFSGPPNSQKNFPRGDPAYWDVLRSTATQLIMNLLDIEAPMIACINGPASRHAELPFGADIVLAAEDASIQDSGHYPNRQPPGDGIALLIPFLMGWNRGRYWLYTGQVLGAQEMKEYGLVNEVLPREKLLPRAWELAEHLAKGSPLLNRYTRLMTTAPIKDLVQRYFGYSFALEALACVQESAGNEPNGYRWANFAKRVRALRLYGFHDIRLEEVDPPDRPGPDDVLVAPLLAGICGTDLREYVGPGGGVPDEPHPLTGITRPVILGHEFSARVVAVGDHVNAVRSGDHVAVYPLMHCGTCSPCAQGEYTLCAAKAWTGLSTKWGGFGELAVIPAYQATPLTGLTDLQGAVVEPATVALHAVDRADISQGQTVLVVGCGPIGALAILASFASGAAKVFFAEPNRDRAALGRALGGIHVDGTPQSEVDAAIDCAGKEAGLDLCLDAVRMGGTISIPGVHTRPPTVNVWRITRRSLDVHGSQGYSRSAWDRTIALAAAGRYPIERVVTSTIPFDDIIGRGFDALLEHTSGQVKVLVEIN